MTRVRRFYGGQPLHLLASIVSFALVAAGAAGWFQPGVDPRGILVWLLGCVLVFEWILIPLAWLLDRIAFGVSRAAGESFAPTQPREPTRGAGRAYVRVPALLSALLLLVFAPLIFQFGRDDYIAFTGLEPSGYLARWLLASAVLFGISALVFAFSLARRGSHS